MMSDCFGEGFGDPILCANDCLVDFVDVIGFILCVSMGGDCGDDGDGDHGIGGGDGSCIVEHRLESRHQLSGCKRGETVEWPCC